MAIEEQPGQFNMKDLALDVRLKAIVDGNEKDFTGKDIFSVDFFRKSVGFGITDIDIEVNTSLQPIITINFKDLYGNTVFGKSIDKSSDLGDENQSQANFSALFNWPPPKFLFTFKGFLGRSATWMLNMKKSSVSYDSSDGSYNIKCEFVPNQWGFLSDLPFLYLLAVKGLKKRSLSPEEFKKEQTIFDLIKIGKQVEIKTKETTKEFDAILKQMTLLKANRVYDAISISKVVNYNETINGTVGNTSIVNFNPITIYDPGGGGFASGNVAGTGNSAVSSPEKQRALALNATDLRRFNTFLLLTAQIGSLKPLSVQFDSLVADGGKLTAPGVDVDTEVKTRLKIVDENIKQIEKTIKAKTYDSSKNQLAKITIGEIFEQLAKDAGYIMGSILQAGYDGYNDPNFTGVRDSAKGELIGKSFPLWLTSDKKEEKPATKDNAGIDFGVEIHELAFVDTFIEAISEGIATELLPDGQTVPEQELIKKRISNVEALRPNPYKPFYRNIAENIMIRGGVVGYLTRSPDPNYPGDYDTYFGGDRGTDAESILPLADADLENIDDTILEQLPEEEFTKLRRFCVFWDNFLTSDSENFLILDSEGKLVEGSPVPVLGINDILPGGTYDYPVMISKPSQLPSGVYPFPFNGTANAGSQIGEYSSGTYPAFQGLSADWDFMTLRQIVQDVWRTKPAGAGAPDSTNSRLIDFDALNSTRVVNNGIAYSVPPEANEGSADYYVYVLFDGANAAKTQEVMSSASDGEVKNTDKEEQKEEDQPLGFVQIVDPSKDGELLPIIDYMNDDRIEEGLMIDYNKLVNPNSGFFDYSGSLDYFLIQNKLGDPTNLGANEISARNTAIAVAYHPYGNNLVFGPFYGESQGLVHRAYIKRICAQLRGKLDGIEEKRNQVIAQVLGKSGEQQAALYKQMHVLYQQWEVLMIKDSDASAGQNSQNDSPGAILSDMASRYENHENFNFAQKVAEEAADNTFLYGYPLNSAPGITPINVRNSIINIEPLYKPNGSSTVLNIIQQICTKNNFIFIPMPGGAGAFNTSEIFSPHVRDEVKVKNFFYVQFAPTPESRSTLSSTDDSPMASSDNIVGNLPEGTLRIKFGSTENQIVKNITVDTQESKATAESIVNLQRLVDNENQNKTVTTDCSMLPVMEGRSYKASAEMIGNAQIFPMQFFFLDAIPLFNGLYQIMKVKHSIKPNDMTTTAEGIRMRMGFRQGDFGGIPPVTTDSLEELSKDLKAIEPPTRPPSASEFLNAVLDQGSGVGDGGRTGSEAAGSSGPVTTSPKNSGGADIIKTSTVNSSGIIMPPDLVGVRNSIRITQSSDGNKAIPIGDFTTSNGVTYTKADIIRNMNYFIEDVLGPFATYLKTNYPHLYKNWYITSATRSYVPKGGSKVSQHQTGQAIDSQIIGGKDINATMASNLELMNAILTWYQSNPVGYDQILWETRKPSSSWIHWSYKRPNNTNRIMLLRFKDDSTYQAAVNKTGAYIVPPITASQMVLSM